MGCNNDCLHQTCWLKKSRSFLLEQGSFQLSPNILRYLALTPHLLRTQANLKIHHAILDASSSASSQVLKKLETVRLELQIQLICFILQSFVRKRDEQLYDDNITTKTKLHKKCLHSGAHSLNRIKKKNLCIHAGSATPLLISLPENLMIFAM
jgi:hypothetical protein